MSQSDKFCLSQIKATPVGPYRSVRNKLTNKKTDYSVIRTFLRTIGQKECRSERQHLYYKVKNMLHLLLLPSQEELAENNLIIEQSATLSNFKDEVSRSVMDLMMAKVYSSVQLRAQPVD